VARSYVAEARRKKVAPKKERIRPVIDRLAAEHPDATIALEFKNPLELLISVMLSAQTTDVNVNRVTEKLFVKYRRPEDYLAVPVEELEQDIFATGFYRQKAKSLRGAMQKIIEDYDGEVPEDFDELLKLPGVARKTANDLVRLVPREDWARFPHLLIWHGRQICDARRPRCEECPLALDLCPSSRI
jgi:endonuclease-3